ncbi:MAG: hypothetical protein ACK5YO_35355, partial [Planctomyces sp.]
SPADPGREGSVGSGSGPEGSRCGGAVVGLEGGEEVQGAEDVAGAVEFLSAGVTAAGGTADVAGDGKPAANAGAAVDPLQLWCHALLCSSGFLYAE